MTIASLRSILNIFGGAEPTQEDRQQLVKEALLMTLARASSSDTNMKPVEVNSVRKVIKRVTGEDVSEADVRVAGHSQLFETSSLDSVLSKLSQKLSLEDRALIAQSLAEVIRSDHEIGEHETAFFDNVSGALKLSPSALAGLLPTKS